MLAAVSAIVVGSGPSAAGTCLGLIRAGERDITVLDIGADLEPENRLSVARLRASNPDAWTGDDLLRITRRSTVRPGETLPQKLVYGSDYPFRDVGQISPMATGPGVDRTLISGARAGYSAAWGAQVLPFAADAFADWPFDVTRLGAHYRSIMEAVPIAAVSDDLAEKLPLWGRVREPFPLSPRGRRVLSRYERRREKLRRRGLVVGRGRVAADSRGCVLCNLCMTGCPYSLIYSSAQTIDALVASGAIRYRPGLRVTSVGGDESGAHVLVADASSTRGMHRFEADRVFVACGPFGTARLVLSSLSRFDQSLEMRESAQFVVPCVSTGYVAASEWKHAMGELSLLMTVQGMPGQDVHLQLYTRNEAFRDALPASVAWLLTEAGDRPRGLRWLPQPLDHLTVLLGYLPSRLSPALSVRLHRPLGENPPVFCVEEAGDPSAAPDVVRRAVRQLLRMAPALDLYPSPAHARLSPPGKSFHCGGCFPHAAAPRSWNQTDVVGRLEAWPTVHLVDGSVFPSFPSTTFTLTVMANAHRIATEALAAR
jgi:ferredoxin